MSEFRTIDGSGNNLENPGWGQANSPLIRNVPPAYEGLNSPSGSNRPNPKTISDIVCRQSKSIKNTAGLSDYMWAWGQFLDHELDLSPEGNEELLIELPDPVNGTDHIPFARSTFDVTTGTSLDNPREQLNVISAFVDAANVYGTSPARASFLRTFDGSGKLKTSDEIFLPKNPGGFPNAPSTATNFFIAGDIRANEHVVLISMHTLFVREHNRICDWLQSNGAKMAAIGAENKDEPRYRRGMPALTTDEMLYQHARRIVAGIMQYITYEEFLPALLGEHGIRPYSGYNQNINASICNIFSTAAYRLGHSMLSPMLKRSGMADLEFKDAFFRPNRVEDDGIETYLVGLATQKMEQIDARAIDAVRVQLFNNLPTPLIDLAALNIQRGRDHGLADYNACRAAYGLARKNEFRDITSDREMQKRLESAYCGNIDLVDPWIGGLAEDHHDDAVVGELFFHVLKDQFERIRDGDRFWYQNDPALDSKDRILIEESRLSEVIKRNSVCTVSNLQPNVFRVVENGRAASIGRTNANASTRSKSSKAKPRQKRKTKGRKRSSR